jgi:hypothetical protein
MQEAKLFISVGADNVKGIISREPSTSKIFRSEENKVLDLDRSDGSIQEDEAIKEMENAGFFSKACAFFNEVVFSDHIYDFLVGDHLGKVSLFNVELLYPSDALDNGLSYTKMIKVTESRHPRILEGNEL